MSVSNLKIGSLVTPLSNGRRGITCPVVAMTPPRPCGDGSGLFSYVTLANTRQDGSGTYYSWTSSIMAEKGMGRFWELSGEVDAKTLDTTMFPADDRLLGV